MCFQSSIKELRRERKLSQVKLAELVNTSPANIGAYEEGRAFPRKELLKRVVDVLQPGDLYIFLFGEPVTEKQYE